MTREQAIENKVKEMRSLWWDNVLATPVQKTAFRMVIQLLGLPEEEFDIELSERRSLVIWKRARNMAHGIVDPLLRCFCECKCGYPNR